MLWLTYKRGNEKTDMGRLARPALPTQACLFRIRLALTWNFECDNSFCRVWKIGTNLAHWLNFSLKQNIFPLFFPNVFAAILLFEGAELFQRRSVFVCFSNTKSNEIIIIQKLEVCKLIRSMKTYFNGQSQSIFLLLKTFCRSQIA